MPKDKYYVTTFCNKAHRLSDGKPLEHECYVLPTELLVAERKGDRRRCEYVMDNWKKRRVHRGVRPSAGIGEDKQ